MYIGLNEIIQFIDALLHVIYWVTLMEHIARRNDQSFYYLIWQSQLHFPQCLYWGISIKHHQVDMICLDYCIWSHHLCTIGSTIYRYVFAFQRYCKYIQCHWQIDLCLNIQENGRSFPSNFWFLTPTETLHMVNIIANMCIGQDWVFVIQIEEITSKLCIIGADIIFTHQKD